MRKLHFFRLRVMLLALPLLLVLLAGVHSSPGRVEAIDPTTVQLLGKYAWWVANKLPIPGSGGPTGDEFSCWVTGPLAGDADDHWGVEDEFVVDRRDLGHDSRFTSQIEPGHLGGDHVPTSDAEPDVYTLFDTLPELVEYGFALDTVKNDTSLQSDRLIYDRRVKLLANRLVAGSVTYPPADPSTGEDTRILLPWANLDKYRARRAVAAPYDEAVTSYEVGWHDSSTPAGGSQNDAVGMAQDQVSNWVENMESTTSHAGGGGIIHYGTTEGVGQQVLFQADEDCGNLGVCNGLVNFSSNPIPITLHHNVREQNDGQFNENVVGPGERVLLAFEGVLSGGEPVGREVEVEWDNRRVPPSNTPLLDAGSGGLVRQFQSDTSADVIRVNIELLSKYRKDLASYEPGAGYDSRSLPAMGFAPWTYDRTSKVRDPEVNEWFREDLGSDGGELKHQGYRQPTLSRSYSPAPNINYGGLTRESAEHIRWPVNFEDLSWYLYRLPTTGYRDPLWLYWVTPRGVSWLINSGYGETAIPFPSDGDAEASADDIPHCFLPADDDRFLNSQTRSPLNIDRVICEHVTEGWGKSELEALAKGAGGSTHLPFDFPHLDDLADSKVYLLNKSLLVKQGVESAEDAGGPLGSRRLSRFSFSILEEQRMGEIPPDQRGYEAEKRYGIPRDPRERQTYLSNWADGPMDPNLPHMLVVAFYEARAEDGLKFQYTGKDEYGGDDFSIRLFELPKREIRRVVCRMMVYPAGFDPPTGEMKSLAEVLADKFGAIISAKFEAFKSIVERILAAAARIPLHLGAQTAELACYGMAKVDDLTDLENVAGPKPPALVDREGRIRINVAETSRNAGSDLCHRIATPPTTTCERSSDFIFEGQCTRLPEFKMQVRAAEFVRPPSPVGISFREFRYLPDHEAYYSEHGEQDFVRIKPVIVQEPGEPGRLPSFQEVANLGADPLPELTVYNRGLTRVLVDWDHRWKDGVDPNIYDHISGFTIYIHPDQKSVPFEVPDGGIAFDLPKWVRAQMHDSDDGFVAREFQINNLTVGGLDHYLQFSTIALPNSVSLVSVREHGFVAPPPDSNPINEFDAVGNSDLGDSFRAFNSHVANMPLAPGFKHGFQIAPYVGVPGDPSFRRGPLSDTIWLNGDDIACNEIRRVAPHPYPHPPADVELVQDLYNCGPAADAAELGYAPDKWRPGLLALSGTDICDDIFSSTPAGLTWDNPIVRQVWLLMTVIGGSILFTLFAWQGLRMTYDIWLDPQPATGFRELVPRFLLAAALMASSLVICQLILIVASDLTCFVAQFTGMSMWGAIGVTFGSIVDGYMVWYEDTLKISDHTLLFLLTNFILTMAFGFMVVLVMLYLLYLFVRVFFGMLMRIAFLAVLTAMAPIAFALYASDATSHWTKRWVSMFLGATFQQVVVLIVIYIGVSLIGTYLSEGVESDIGNMVAGMIIAFLTLSLAVSVPGLVNPEGNRMFSSFGQIGSIAASGALMLASAGVSAAAGGVRGGIGGIGGGGGGGSSPQAPPSSPGGGPGAGPGGVSGPSSSGVPPGGNIMSSVNRQHLGPSTVPPMPTTLSTAPSPAQPSSMQPGSTQPGSTQPGSTQPGSTQPGSTQPGSTPSPSVGPGPGPGPAAPSPSVQPSGGASGPGDPDPGDPDPGDPGSGDGGYTISSAPQPGASPGSGASPSGPAPSGRGAESSPGLFRRVGSGMVGGMTSGWRSGLRRGAGLNVRAANLASGRTFYQFSSKGDDSAQQVSKLRDEMGRDRRSQKEFYAQFARAFGFDGDSGQSS